MAKGSGTRSGLLWEVERILDECEGNLPDVLLMENVAQVISKKNIKDFQKWRKKLENLGYSNYVQLLNAKNYGIPQNRVRCFMVSILGNYHYSFPNKVKLEKRLKDMLDDNVDEKYYLSDKAINGFLANNLQYANKDTTSTHEQQEQIDYHEIKLAHGWNKGSIKKKDVISTIDSGVDKWHTLIGEVGGVAIKNNNSKGYLIAQSGDGIDISSRMQHHRGTVQKGISQTLDTQCNVGVIDE